MGFLDRFRKSQAAPTCVKCGYHGTPDDFTRTARARAVLIDIRCRDVEQYPGAAAWTIDDLKRIWREETHHSDPRSVDQRLAEYDSPADTARRVKSDAARSRGWQLEDPDASKQIPLHCNDCSPPIKCKLRGEEFQPPDVDPDDPAYLSLPKYCPKCEADMRWMETNRRYEAYPWFTTLTFTGQESDMEAKPNNGQARFVFSLADLHEAQLKDWPPFASASARPEARRFMEEAMRNWQQAEAEAARHWLVIRSIKVWSPYPIRAYCRGAAEVMRDKI